MTEINTECNYHALGIEVTNRCCDGTRVILCQLPSSFVSQQSAPGNFAIALAARPAPGPSHLRFAERLHLNQHQRQPSIRPWTPACARMPGSTIRLYEAGARRSRRSLPALAYTVVGGFPQFLLTLGQQKALAAAAQATGTM